ncbi:hypothetical protein O0881_27100 [Janthinobacterium sp. SUN100]|uniref:hypothetical protein n=1 Tax=Janthinobacterium sp. SUN100 TaxID=3004101 RepID=UPI0025B109DC|nr:hypothetical protein [Janthinobacterium sp. SUN100]MDN2705668.1 hypothetical protein [Janthinobacterium sp. SUN100]
MSRIPIFLIWQLAIVVVWSNMRHPYPPYSAIELALNEVILAARLKGVSFKNTELITTSEEWDRELVVLFFYQNDTDVQWNQETGINEWLQRKFVHELNATKVRYGFSEFPEITFMFDSEENVKANFQGDYFLRLR